VVCSIPYLRTLDPVLLRSSSQLADYLNDSTFVAADAEEEPSDINNSESARGMNNKPTSTTTETTRRKRLMTSKPTVFCTEVPLLWTPRMVIIVCITFRGWRGLCGLLGWLETASSKVIKAY